MSKKKLQQTHSFQLILIRVKELELQPLKDQQSDFGKKLQEKRNSQHHMKGLPLHLLKQNYQKQINVIDEELNQ